MLTLDKISDDTYLRDAEKLGGVTQAPVAEFVGQHSDNLLFLALLDQGVVDDDVLLPGQTEEIGIAVGAALAAVDDVQLVKRELELLGELLDIRLELALVQGRELVKQRQNGDGVDGNHKDLQASAEHPEVVEELATSLLDDGQEAGQNRGSQDNGQKVALDQIRNKQLGSLLVEAEFLFQNEGVVEAGWERQNLVDDDERQDEDDGLRDLAGEAGRREAKEKMAGP